MAISTIFTIISFYIIRLQSEVLNPDETHSKLDFWKVCLWRWNYSIPDAWRWENKIHCSAVL